MHVFDDLLDEPFLKDDALLRGRLLNRQPQFVNLHIGDESDVFLDQLGELGERAEAIEKIGAHCQNKFDRTRRVLRDLDERRDEALAQPLVGNREDFLKLSDENEPLVAFSL